MLPNLMSKRSTQVFDYDNGDEVSVYPQYWRFRNYSIGYSSPQMPFGSRYKIGDLLYCVRGKDQEPEVTLQEQK